MYSVRVSDLKVLDQNGQEVPDAWVIALRFPEISTDTAYGKVWHIAGPAVATIKVRGDLHFQIPCI